MGKVYGLLGEKLGHSFSPLIHGFLGEYDYSLFEVEPDHLASFLVEKRFDGINVTIPYKQTVIPYCTDLSEEARIIGSVNTIIKDKDGNLHGYNTDYHGFRVMLEKGGIDPGGKKALVLGDGGAARTVRAVLTGLGAREIVTISRRGEENYSNVYRHYDAEVIINTTPVGMYPNNGASPLPLAGFEQLAYVADLIYNPLRTKLLLDAESIGATCVNGLIMLVAQAEMASRLFLEGPMQPRAELVDTIHDSILKETRSIALIGMPGCGKSTVGYVLAEKMKRPFSDIDDLISEAAMKTIPEIFAEEGEGAFRRLETRILAEESGKSGIVIATGGGVVTQPENLDLLRQNCLIVYLARSLDELISDGRPLSESKGVRTLADQRLHLYEAWSNHIVQVRESPELTSARIIEALNGK